tara:strand:- start:759 stop:887 length:129 start_codon:yes stop_codon:yes gene_type:complete
LIPLPLVGFSEYGIPNEYDDRFQINRKFIYSIKYNGMNGDFT